MDDPGLVVDFLNTLDVEKNVDVLAHEPAWQRWTAERGLVASSLNEARAARAALRAAVGDPDAPPGPVRAAIDIELRPGGPALVADGAVGAILAAATRLAVLGDWKRLKICPADDCRWAFYDQSRNRSRTWCSMSVCGNREKARSWRARVRSPE